MSCFAQLRTSSPVARIALPHASRLYSTENGNVQAKLASKPNESKPATHAIDGPDLDELFKFGDSLSEIDQQNKTIETAVGSLPISPLLDPTWRTAREPQKKKKPRPFENKNRFQQRMHQNPYAQLLAEPVRGCHVTRARLPKPFLQGFGLVTHPETNNLWWIPAGFEIPSKGGAAGTPNEAKAQSVNGNKSVPSNEPATDRSVSSDQVEPNVVAEDDDAGATTRVQEAPPAKQNRSFRAPAHVLARQDLLLEFQTKNSKHSGGQYRFGIVQSIGKLIGQATWRQDMHEVLRERMRCGIVDVLIDVSKTCENGDRNHLVTIETPQDSLRYQNRICFLTLTGECSPFDYLEVPGVPGSARPIYHLPDLLGAEQMQRLKSTVPLFGDESPLWKSDMVLLKGKAHIELSKSLWRLQGFVANYAELN